MEDLAKMLANTLSEYGPIVTIVVSLLLINGFFVWRDFKRENRQQAQLDELHRVHQQTIVPLLTECKEAIAVSKEVIAQNSQIIMRLINRDG